MRNTAAAVQAAADSAQHMQRIKDGAPAGQGQEQQREAGQAASECAQHDARASATAAAAEPSEREGAHTPQTSAAQMGPPRPPKRGVAATASGMRRDRSNERDKSNELPASRSGELAVNSNAQQPALRSVEGGAASRENAASSTADTATQGAYNCVPVLLG